MSYQCSLHRGRVRSGVYTINFLNLKSLIMSVELHKPETSKNMVCTIHICLRTIFVANGSTCNKIFEDRMYEQTLSHHKTCLKRYSYTAMDWLPIHSSIAVSFKTSFVVRQSLFIHPIREIMLAEWYLPPYRVISLASVSIAHATESPQQFVYIEWPVIVYVQTST